MTKTKSKNIMLVLVVALLTLSTTSFAAVYDWIGTSGDNWETPGNWDVTGSTWTWPNEEYGDSRVNQDCEEINITTGDIVDRFNHLAMSGASEGSNETVLTIRNNSGLHIGGHMWIGQNGDGTVQVEVRNGSSLTVDKVLIVGDAEESTGLLDVTNGAVEVKEGMFVGKAHNSTGKMQIKGNVPGAGYDLNVWKSLSVGDSDNSVGTVEIKSSSVKIGRDLNVGKTGSSTGTVEIKSSTVDIGSILFIGKGSTGMFEIKDSTLDTGSNLVVGRDEGSTGTVEIKDSTLDIQQLLILTRWGTSGIMNIKGNSIIIINERFQMGAKPTMNAVSKLVMDDGVVTVGSDSRLNMAGAAGSMADFTLNDGTWINGGNIYVGETPEGDCYLTINGGTMVSDSMIFVGNPGGDDIGESIIFLNGGVLQGEGLEFNMDADSLIVYRGGELRIRNSALDETDMQNLIDIGKIDVPSDYEITTIGDYTVLRS